MSRIYHEKQDAALCGVHALNNLLQGPLFTEIDLMHIAHDLDASEKAMMMEMGTDSADFLKFMAEESGNVAEDGNFSIEVLKAALAVWSLEPIPLTHPSVVGLQDHPEREDAYLCNLMSHWFSIRKINGVWWNVNSVIDRPQRLSDLYLGAYLKQLQVEGYTIFVVRGSWPNEVQDYSDKNWTVVGGPSTQRSSEDDDLKRAIALSLQANQNTPSDFGQKHDPMIIPDDDDEDADLRAAIAMSLQSSATTVNNSEAKDRSIVPSERPTKRIRTVPPEPAQGAPNSLTLTVRLIDGTKKSRRFNVSDTIGDVSAWLEEPSFSSSSCDMNKHVLLLNFPRVKLLDDSATLGSVGINGPTALTLTDRE
jgi:ataxin-3